MLRKFLLQYYETLKSGKTCKILFCICTLFVYSNRISKSFAQARAGDQELSVMIGKGSFTQQVDLPMADPTSTKHEDVELQNLSDSYIYTANYRIYVRDRLALGLSASTESFSFSVFDDSKPSRFTLNGTVVNIVVDLKHIYRQSKYFQFYSVYDLGFRYYHETENPTQPETWIAKYMFNTQISPLCFSFGNPISAFVELGVGYKGWVCGGISYKIRCSKAILQK